MIGGSGELYTNPHVGTILFNNILHADNVLTSTKWKTKHYLFNIIYQSSRRQQTHTFNNIQHPDKLHTYTKRKPTTPSYFWLSTQRRHFVFEPTTPSCFWLSNQRRHLVFEVKSGGFCPGTQCTPLHPPFWILGSGELPMSLEHLYLYRLTSNTVRWSIRIFYHSNRRSPTMC